MATLDNTQSTAFISHATTLRILCLVILGGGGVKLMDIILLNYLDLKYPL